MGKKAQHVVPNGAKWSVRKAGSSRATGTFDTQGDAIKEVSLNSAEKSREIKERNYSYMAVTEEFANLILRELGNDSVHLKG